MWRPHMLTTPTDLGATVSYLRFTLNVIDYESIYLYFPP